MPEPQTTGSTSLTILSFFQYKAQSRIKYHRQIAKDKSDSIERDYWAEMVDSCRPCGAYRSYYLEALKYAKTDVIEE